VATSVAIGPRTERYAVTWYGAIQCVDLRPRKTSLESVFLGPLPEQKQDSHWSLTSTSVQLAARDQLATSVQD